MRYHDSPSFYGFLPWFMLVMHIHTPRLASTVVTYFFFNATAAWEYPFVIIAFILGLAGVRT